jgi:Tetratricopeptide repeat
VTQDEMRQCLLAAREMVARDDPENALPLLMSVLAEDPNNPFGLHVLGWLYMKSGEAYLPLAYQIYRRAIAMYPDRREMWNNLSRCADELHRYEEALGISLKSLEVDANYAPGYSNVACSLINLGRYAEALKYAEAGLEIAPEDRNCLCNKGFALLGLQQWDKAWEFYEHTLGHRYRLEWIYGEEPRWDGSKDKVVIVYGEQGLGDELMYAQCLPEAIRDCRSVLLDCDHRLAGLFQRSFPHAGVHGTRRRNEVAWLNGIHYDARCAIGSLASIYRKTPESFFRSPYLVADPERRKMWRALFKGYAKPVIGIAWTGGRSVTGEKFRRMDLSDFLPLMRAFDATWVSLEWKDRSEEIEKFRNEHGILVHDYPWIHKSEDYDDTAAMAAELDMVVGAGTASLHLAGALGIPTVCLVPKYPQWVFAGEDMPWYGCMRLVKQKMGQEWREVIEEAVDGPYFSGLSERARKAA